VTHKLDIAQKNICTLEKIMMRFEVFLAVEYLQTHNDSAGSWEYSSRFVKLQVAYVKKITYILVELPFKFALMN